MRVLFASVEDVHNVGAWSGTPHHVHAALVGSGTEVMAVSPLPERFGLPLKAAQAVHNQFGSRYYTRHREPVVLRGYARRVEANARRSGVDVVLALSSLPVALLRGECPVVYWADATFGGMVGYYPSFRNLSPRLQRLGHSADTAALQRASLAVFSSDWAARTAVELHGADPERVAVVPYGANTADPGRPPPFPRDSTCRLLLVGKDWHRKGVDLAVETVQQVREQGIDAVLDVVGCSPPSGTRLPLSVTVHGSLRKDDAADARVLRELYRCASFFLLPSRADCSPIVLAEAQAHGVPVVASDTGGMASMLRDGRSGRLVPLDGFPATAARSITETWLDRRAHERMAAEARCCYETLLNWPVAVGTVLDLVEKRLRG